MSKEVKIELIVDSAEAQKNIKDVNKGLDRTDKNLKQTNKSAEKGKKGFRGLAVGARAFGAALKAAGIGIVLGLLAGLSTALTNNQKVMDLLSTAGNIMNQVFTDLIGSLFSTFEQVTKNKDSYDALLKSVLALVNFGLANLQGTLSNIRRVILEGQLAYEKSFLGDGDPKKIKELVNNIREAREGMRQAFETQRESVETIVKNSIEATGELINLTSESAKNLSEVNLKSSIENAIAITEVSKASQIAAAKNQGIIEEFDRLAEKQRQIRDDDRKSIQERIEANDKLLEHLEEQRKTMLRNAKIMEQEAQLRFDMSKKDEDFIKLQEAKNNLKAIEAQIEGFMSEQKSNAVALEKELNELEISGLQNKAELQKAERDFKAEMMQDDVKRTQMLIDNLAIEKELDRERLQSKIDSFQAGTQAQQDAQQELDLFLAESARTEKKLKADLVKFTDAADKKSADNEKKLQKQKVENIRGALSDIASIVGANSKFGKAIAIVQAIQDTFAGANKAFSQAGIFGFISGAAIIAQGLANVKTIAGTKTPKPPASLGARDTGESAPAIPATATASLPPQFDTVGASGINQLADVLGNQAPPRAFVVSGDVSTAQELDRNIISSASIG